MHIASSLLTRSRGAVVNFLSGGAGSRDTGTAVSSIFKAATLSLTQSLCALSQLLAEGWREGVAKPLERQNAALVTSRPVRGLSEETPRCRRR